MKRRYVYLLAAYSCILCGADITRAVLYFSDPSPPSFVNMPQWYEDLLSAGLFLIIAIACIVYLRRTMKAEAGEGKPLQPPRWRDQRELRFVLYAFATVQFIGVPLAAYKTIRALHSPLHSSGDTFLSVFPFEALVFAAIGVAVIAYDRRRMRRESWQMANHCPVCGYDLRATSDRCPECGTPTTAAEDEDPIGSS